MQERLRYHSVLLSRVDLGERCSVRQRYHGGRKRTKASRRCVALLAIGAGIWWALRPFRVAVEGESMAPGLRPGDWLVAVRPRRILRGDVVVLEDPRTPGFELVKRVAGVPGDRVGDGSASAGAVLGPGDYWVLGDSPSRSTDSRAFGPVPRSAIRGVVRLRYWPPGR
jgi:signal peptidase I